MGRVMFTLALITFLLCAARLTLGTPDVVQALTFFAGGIPTQLAGEAVTVLLAWLVILVAVLGLLAGMTRFVDRAQLLRKPSTRATILLAASLMLLVVGAVHRSIPTASVCCGSNALDISEAVHLAQ
jgi:uncharacterized membrane protein YidH (DUF202 family)